MKTVGLKVVFALFLVLCIIIPVQAHAVSVGKITVGAPTIEKNKGYAIGIILSKSCIILVKAGSDKCPTYKELATLDNSIPAYSGTFKDVNGFYQRMQPKYPNTMGFYQYDNTFRIFVDPPQTAKMPLITIETRLPEYHIDGQFKVKEIKDHALADSKAFKSVREYSHTRYVDKTCSFAVITADNWEKVLPDTITYMRANCDDTKTQVLTLAKDIKNLKSHDIATTSKYKLEKFYKDTIKNCTKSYQACKTISNPAVTTDGTTR